MDKIAFYVGVGLSTVIGIATADIGITISFLSGWIIGDILITIYKCANK